MSNFVFGTVCTGWAMFLLALFCALPLVASCGLLMLCLIGYGVALERLAQRGSQPPPNSEPDHQLDDDASDYN